MKYNIKMDDICVAILFAGCGWMHPFEFGVAKFFSDIFIIDHKLIKFGGCSAGAFVASTLALGLDVDELFEKTMTQYNSCKYNPFAMCKSVKNIIDSIAPDDSSWANLNGRLIIGVTEVTFNRFFLSCKPKYIDTFNTAKYAHNIIRATSHLPIIGGILPYHGFYDGGLSMIVPDVKDSFCITIDGRPLPNYDCDIVPNIGFIIPMIWAYIPRNPSMLRKIKKLGYYRAVEFIFSDEIRFKKINHIMKKNISLKNRDHLLKFAKNQIKTIIHQLNVSPFTT